MWLTASEIVGSAGMPTTERNIRENLKQLATPIPELARKREGTKAFEYHISILPAATQAAIYKRAGQVKVGEKVFNIPSPKAERYCREALWARWNNAGNSAQEKAKEKLTYITALNGLINSGIGKMAAYQAICDEYGVSFANVRRDWTKVARFDEQDWLPILLPKHKESAATIRKSRFAYITPEAWDFIKSDYLRQEEPTFSVCYERLKDTAKLNDWKVPSKKSLERRMQFEVPQEQRTLLRKGEHALMMMRSGPQQLDT